MSLKNVRHILKEHKGRHKRLLKQLYKNAIKQGDLRRKQEKIRKEIKEIEVKEIEVKEIEVKEIEEEESNKEKV